MFIAALRNSQEAGTTPRIVHRRMDSGVPWNSRPPLPPLPRPPHASQLRCERAGPQVPRSRPGHSSRLAHAAGFRPCVGAPGLSTCVLRLRSPPCASAGAPARRTVAAGEAVASSSSRLQVCPPLQTVLGAQEWTQSKTQQEFSQRPLGRIVSLLLNRGLTREVGKGGEQARSPPRAGVPRGRSRTGPKPAPSPDSCVRARGGPTRPRQRWAPGAARRPSCSGAARAREGHTLPGSDDAGRRGSGEGPIGIDVLTGSASPDDRKRLCVRALGRK